jgi:hypothetical protein
MRVRELNDPGTASRWPGCSRAQLRLRDGRATGTKNASEDVHGLTEYALLDDILCRRAFEVSLRVLPATFSFAARKLGLGVAVPKVTEKVTEIGATLCFSIA